jgi:hypothetical protein
MLPSKYVKGEEYVPKESTLWTNKRNKCTICGALTSGNLCLKCFKTEKSKNIPTREDLIKDLLSKESLVKLASKYGISDNAYGKWLAKRGLPIKSKDIKSFILSV